MRITHEKVESWVKSAGCGESWVKSSGCGEAQYKKFCELYPAEQYPDGVLVTEAACAAVGAEFNWDWIANLTLKKPLLKEYTDGRDAIWAEYQVELENMYTNDLARRRDLGDYLGRSGSWGKVKPLWLTYHAKLAPLFGRLAEQMPPKE